MPSLKHFEKNWGSPGWAGVALPRKHQPGLSVYGLQQEESDNRCKLETRWLGGLGSVSAQGFIKQELKNANIPATGCGVLTRGPAPAWVLVYIISHNWCCKWQPVLSLC